MNEQVASFCPACGNVIKVGNKFCTSCGVKLDDISVNEITSETPPQSQTADVMTMESSILEGWEISSDRMEYYEKIISTDPVGNPIITSKCKLDRENGLLIVSDNGFAWRIRMGFTTGFGSIGKSKWVRWHDVSNITPRKEGVILVELKIRKYGSLLLDGAGNPRKKRWKFTIQQNKDEPRPNFIQRQQNFNNIMSEIYNRNKGETDPPTSDSRM